MITDHRSIEALARDAFACHFDQSDRPQSNRLAKAFAVLRAALSNALTSPKSAHS